MYIFEILCTSVCTVYDVSTDLFVFVIFLLFNFASGLLCERIESIGLRGVVKRGKSSQGFNRIEVYQDLIEFINVHYKFER